MTEIEFIKFQLSCVNKSIEALCGVVDIPKELIIKKELFEQQLQSAINNKIFDEPLIKE